MAKTKTPFHSFKAHGTIAGPVTYQDRNSATMVRRKPIPTDRKSLPQIYHRWLYQDYAALWHTLSVAQKQQWESDARPLRITGFNYWMQYYLNNLPDIAGMWHLDFITGNTAIDFSKNANNGVIYGALPTKGIIQNALRFDGVDDYVTFPDSPSLTTFSAITIQGFVYSTDWSVPAQVHTLFRKGTSYLFRISEAGKMGFAIHDGTSWTAIWNGTLTLQPFTFYLITAVWDGTTMFVYRDSTLDPTSIAFPGPLRSEVASSYIGLGYLPSGELFNGILDHVIIYNRALHATEIKRHSERRYPL